MQNKWERRESKQKAKKKFSPDNRKSVRLLEQLSMLPNKSKQNKEFEGFFRDERFLNIVSY